MDKIKYVAIPARPDGTDRAGNLGDLRGEYVSLANFKRYRVLVHGQPGQKYNLYIDAENGYRRVGTVTVEED